jgi:DNA-directed RNA polymerase subunit RPC12/RpoP
MQIEANQSVCPACGARALEIVPVFHHMICAYVGPQYDFIPIATGYSCPKCWRGIVSGDTACEIVGTSARCIRCGKEMIVPPPTTSF